MQNILFTLLILMCAGNVVNLFQPRKEKEEESVSLMDATVHAHILHEMHSKAFTAIFGAHRCAKKVRRRQQHTGRNLLTLLLLLLLSAVTLIPAFQQQISWQSTKRSINFCYARELKTCVFDKLFKPVLSPGGKSANCLDPISEYSCSEWKLPSFLRRHRILQNVTSFIFPAHLQKYFEEVGNHGTSVNVMRHEWARYESFKKFPRESPAMPIRLAAAGFYHIGPADRVQCFSCQMVYGGWKIEDIPLDIHRRLSPICKFLGENEDGNLSIHEDNAESQSNYTQTHAQCGLAPNTTVGFCMNMNSNGTCFETTDYVTEEPLQLDPVEDDFLETCKHPQYKEFTVRLSSYSKWPCGDVQDPSCLAEAGFFYAGIKYQMGDINFSTDEGHELRYMQNWPSAEAIDRRNCSNESCYHPYSSDVDCILCPQALDGTGFSDCVRCFCCGLGLRNWEFGDGAWSEHERWSADCIYLTRRREDNQNTTEDTEIQTPSSAANIYSNTLAERAITGAEANRQDDSEITESKNANDFEAGINKENTLENGPGSFCVSQVLPMGFDRALVEEAVKACEGGEGKVFTCEELIEVILEIERSQSTTSASPMPTNVVEPAASSKQPTISEKFADKISPERNYKTSISRYDNSLSIDCLREENRRLKDQLLCKICLDKEANVVLMPCGHMVSCETCAHRPALKKCPMCRKLVRDRVKAYLS